jgi:hypothetical protein
MGLRFKRHKHQAFDADRLVTKDSMLISNPSLKHPLMKFDGGAYSQRILCRGFFEKKIQKCDL